MEDREAMALLVEAFNAVFETHVDGESRESITSRLAAEVATRQIPSIGSDGLDELAEAVEDRTPVFLLPEGVEDPF